MHNLIPLLLLCAGCLQPTQPPQSWSATCELAPIICEGSGWTPTEIDAQAQWLNVAYRRTSIAFSCRAPVVEANARFLEFDESVLPDLNGHGESVARSEGVMVVWFVGSIYYRGERMSGLAHYPFGMPGAQYGIVLGHVAASQQGQKTLAHEVGHSLGLFHPWEDQLADTLQTSIGQGCTIQPCLLMNYCFNPQINMGNCQPEEAFTSQQIDEIRRWATSYTRTMMVHAVGELILPQRIETVRSVSEPAVDPIDWR